MPSLHKRPGTDNWHAAFTGPDGRRVFRTTGTANKSAALEILAKYVRVAEMARKGRLTEGRARKVIADLYEIAMTDALPSSSVESFLAGWKTKKGLELSDASLSEYTKVADEFVKHLGPRAARNLDSVTAEDVSNFRAAVAARLSGTSVNKYLKILSSAFTEAHRAGIIPDNVVRRVQLVKVKRGKRRAFSWEELRAILKVCDAEWRGIVLFGVYTGQRLSDVVGLTWRQIDLETATLMNFSTMKTDRPMPLPLAAPLVNYLVNECTAPDDPDAPLFPESAKTLAVNQSTLSRQFGELLARAGLVKVQTHATKSRGRSARRATSDVSFHSLRHTATSLLKNAGVSDVVAREIIGHDSAAISRAYTHIEGNTLRAAMAKLPDVTK
jgi:integrase